MKYCYKCGNQMDDDMLFCQKCGTRNVYDIDKVEQTSAVSVYDKYVGLCYKDFESGNVVELTPDGVRIFHAKGMKTFRFDKIIPYDEILDVNVECASAFKSGYFSIITANEGISGKASRQQLLLDHNTVLFTSKTESEAERVYRAIKNIIASPMGKNVHTTIYQNNSGNHGAISSTTLSKPAKQKKKRGCLATIIVGVIIAIIISSIGSNDSNSDNGNNEDPNLNTTIDKTIILDVEEYGNISGSELITILGEPDEISESTCQGAFEIPCVYYDYSNAGTLGEVSFVLVNDQVVRFTSYSEYPYESKDAVFEQFGITKEETCAVAADTNIALRYRCPSAKVDDFWINLIDGDTFGFLQITYDMEYYEEWYLPLTSSEEIEYKTNAELTMKSLLISPKSADFPWYDWEYGKNLFYVLVSSYVDSENAFGVEMRNTFTFVYSRLTGEIVLAIVNDEVVANNGYVEVEELVMQLYDEMKKGMIETE